TALAAIVARSRLLSLGLGLALLRLLDGRFRTGRLRLRFLTVLRRPIGDLRLVARVPLATFIAPILVEHLIARRTSILLLLLLILLVIGLRRAEDAQVVLGMLIEI